VIDITNVKDKMPKQPLSKPLDTIYQWQIILCAKNYGGQQAPCRNYRGSVDPLKPFVPAPMVAKGLILLYVLFASFCILMNNINDVYDKRKQWCSIWRCDSIGMVPALWLKPLLNFPTDLDNTEASDC